ncbi:MAG: histidinol-phosphatase HisJ family protein [Kosmotoga sp.]|nr:MAG: histidinol-phosphatase HisJ family protein [Kosmotoga sp.]
MIDLHVHTNFSPDASNSLQEVVEFSEAEGMKIVGISDHYDLDLSYKYTTNFGDPLIYLEEIERLNNNTPVKLLKGLELGIQSYTDNNFLNGAFDYFIYSVHQYPGMGDFSGHKIKWPLYLEEALGAVKTLKYPGFFGHLDFLRRYIPDNAPLTPSPLLDELLITLVKYDIGLEINTSGLRNDVMEVHPQTWIIERYINFGGKFITVGSDAHEKNDIGKGFNEALKILNAFDIKELFYCEDGNYIALKMRELTF